MITGGTVPRYSRAMVLEALKLAGPAGAVIPLEVRCSQPQFPLQYEATGCVAQPLKISAETTISDFIFEPFCVC